MRDNKYQKISIACSYDIVETFADFLLKRGTGGIVIEDDISNERTILTAYIDPRENQLFTKEEIETFFESVKTHFDKPGCEIVTLDYIEAQDWLSEWKKTFHPIHITERIVACPSWESYDPKPGEIVIVIDPKMAFGTGHHETTAQCALGLEMLYPVDQCVLDYGCGTGFLAIAAAKMGATKVIGVDNDPEAIKCARENIELNNVKVELFESGEFIADPPVDIIAANLNIGLIIELYANLDGSLGLGGHIIFSGIPIEDRQRFLDFIADKPYDLIDVLTGQEWLSYLAVKKIG